MYQLTAINQGATIANSSAHDGLTPWYARQRVKAFQTNIALHGVSHLYHVLRVIFVLSFVFEPSFKPKNVAYITANRLNFTVMELDSVYLWHLWPLCLKWVSVSVGTDPSCCFRTESCFVFSP